MVAPPFESRLPTTPVPKFTTLFDAVKPVPVMVTVLPTNPEVGAIEPITGTGTTGGVTVTVKLFVAVPPLFVAVSVYVVVEAGETETEVPVTAPTPEMLNEVAPVVDQESTALWP